MSVAVRGLKEVSRVPSELRRAIRFTVCHLYIVKSPPIKSLPPGTAATENIVQLAAMLALVVPTGFTV